MNTHILYLNLILLFASCLPPAICGSLCSLVSKKGERLSSEKILYIMSLSIIFITVLIFLVGPKDIMYINSTKIFLYFATIPLAVLCLALEYIYISLIRFIKGEKPRGLQIHLFWGENLSLKVCIYTIIIGICEEFIYRQLWISILFRSFDLPIIIAILISSIFYGLNHLYFGITPVISKCLVGMIYGISFYISGFSIFIPILIHTLQNLIILSLPKLKKQYK